MRACKRIIFIWATVLMVAGIMYSCKEKYSPQIKDFNFNYLVIEGLINTGTDSTIYTLSRTFKLDNKPIEAPEKGAIVQVESEAGATYVLPALLKSGRYGRPSLGLDPTQRHRLRVRTTDNREYLSDFVEAKSSAPFDLKYTIKDNALNFYIDSHDPSGKSIYYQHSYVETWEYDSQLTSFHKTVNGVRVPRVFPEDNISTCWRTLQSPNILLTSTANLSESRLADKLIVSIPGASRKLNIEYSILVKQTILTKEAFEFYETLRKNTESVGGVFDAQPSILFGNIRSTTNPAETVIGFISAGSVVEKRLTVQMNKDLPLELYAWEDKSICEESVNYIVLPGEPFVYVNSNAGTSPLLYCGDCRLQGGTTQKPSYWK